jgi:hypothetical protein
MPYMPSPWQSTMHSRPEPRKWIWVGRRGGKGRGVLHEALAVINKASFSPFIHEGMDITDSLTPQIHVWTVAPNYGQAQQVWNEMKAFIPAWQSLKYRLERSQHECLARSADGRWQRKGSIPH